MRTIIIEIFDILEVYLPRLIFFIVVVLFGVVVKEGLKESLKEKKQEKESRYSSSSSNNPHRDTSIGTDSLRKQSTNTSFDTRWEEYVQRERKKRVSQLDDWLKNGMIDKKEYNELKKRYKKEGP